MAKNDVRTMAREAYLKLKKYGYVAGIILVALGVSIFLRPVATTTLFTWFLLAGLLVSGISKIVLYFQTPKQIRNGWHLAIGILWLVCACLLLADLFDMPLETTLSIQAVLGIFIGFNFLFSGISSICMSGQIAANGGSKGLAIFAGIIELLCGFCVLSAPLMGLFALTFAFGICLTVSGISMIIRCIAY